MVTARLWSDDYHDLLVGAVAQPSSSILALHAFLGHACISVVRTCGLGICAGASLARLGPSLRSAWMMHMKNTGRTSKAGPLPERRRDRPPEYRTLWGPTWCGPSCVSLYNAAWPPLSLPLALELYLKEPLATTLKVPYRSRTPWLAALSTRGDDTPYPDHPRGDGMGGCYQTSYALSPPMSRWWDGSY